MPMGRMSWEPPEQVDGPWSVEPLPDTSNWDWWNHVLDSTWAADTTIQETCGPEYLMWQDMENFGNEVDFFSRPALAVDRLPAAPWWSV